MSTVAKRYVTDEAFREVANLLYGGGVDVEELVSKANPDQSDLSAVQRKKRERTQARVGLASNVVGIGAGWAALGSEGKKFRETMRAKKGLAPVGPKHLGVGRLSRVKSKYAVPVAAGALGLQAANVGGDLVANRVLNRESKKKVSKADKPNQAQITLTKGKLYRKGIEFGAQEAQKGIPKAKDKFKPLAQKLKTSVQKSQDESEIVWEGEFSKVDSDKRQVFGWASIVRKDGQDVVDLQGDYISIDEIEKSAYDYVIKSRKGGNQHLRDGEAPLHVSDMIESFIVTPEKVEKMGLPEDTPLGWWVGYQINDEDTWQQVKSGKRTGFSIHGRGKRAPVE
jgi:hypothetical protein